MNNLVKTTTVSFNLPFSIHLPDGTYAVKGDNYLCSIKLTKKLAKDNSSGWQGNPQIPNDRFGHTNFTEVLVQFSLDNPNQINDGIPASTRVFALDAINQILNSCRWVFDEFYPHNIVDKDVVAFKYTYQNLEGHEIPGARNFESNGPIRIGNQFSKEQILQLQKILEEGTKIPLDIELIKNAQDHFTFENYKMATLEIQSAVEFVISKKIRNHLDSSISEEELNRILRKGWNELKPHLTDATSDELTSSDECNDWREKCAKLRNKVIHAQYPVNHDEVKDAIDAGKAFIESLNTF